VMELGCLLKYNGPGFFPASMAEPLSCVIGAMHANYHIKPGSYIHDMEIVDGGKLAILAGVGPMGLAAINYAIHREDRKPSLMVVTDIDQVRLDRAAHLYSPELARSKGIDLRYFMDQGVSSYIITNGTEITLSNSDGKLFRIPELKAHPVSKALLHHLKSFKGGDTTGCGDNFVGGVLASMGWQLLENKEILDLEECIAWGTVSGGYGCFHLGGTQIETEPGDKLKKIHLYYDLYKQQIHGG